MVEIARLVSVLKNMTLSGLPLKHIWDVTKKFLMENTGEIADVPSSDGGPEESLPTDEDGEQ